MKTPYRDQYGRFAKRPTPKKRKKHVQQIKNPLSSTSKIRIVRPKSRKRIRQVQPSTPHEKKPTRPKEKAPRRKRLPEKKPTPLRKKEWDTPTMGDILDSYIEELDLDEDTIGDYRDPFQHLYEMLRSIPYRHTSTLLVSKTKLIPWKSKPSGMQIWFLVYYHHEGRYNIEFRNWDNGESDTLKDFVSYIHRYFLADTNASFSREAESTYKHREALHMIALTPLFIRHPQKKKQRTRQGWIFNAPALYKKNPPLKWKKERP